MRTLLLIVAAAEARGFAVHQSGAVLPGIRPIAAVATPLSPKMLAVAGSLPVEYNGCAAVMGGYVMIYYVNMWLSAGTPTDACPAQTTWGNRIFLNMGEQAPAFLTSFWTHAAFASPLVASQVGTAYLGFTVLYTLLRLKNKGGMDVQTGFLTTVPRYAINVFLVSTAVAQRCFGLLKGARAFHAVAFVPVCVLFFILFSKVGESLVPWFKSGGD